MPTLPLRDFEHPVKKDLKKNGLTGDHAKKAHSSQKQRVNSSKSGSKSFFPWKPKKGGTSLQDLENVFNAPETTDSKEEPPKT